MTPDWEENLGRYRAHLELEGMATRTVRARAGLVARLAAWAGELGLSSPRMLTLQILADYRRHRIEGVNRRGRRDKPRTVNTHLLAVRDFVGYMAGRGELPAMLLGSLKYVKEPQLLPRETLSHAEVMRLLGTVPGETPIHVRDRAMLEVFYSTGIRRQELADLELGDVDPEGGVLRVRSGKGGKGRVVPLGKSAAEWLSRYVASARPSLLGRREDGGILFLSKSGRPLPGNSVKEIVLRWGRAAGIPKTVTPHTLRRSCATGMIRNRANPAHVKELLGHSDFSSLDAYIRLEIVDLKDAHKRFHPREQEETARDPLHDRSSEQ
jgi:integrase/recombinase XerD